MGKDRQELIGKFKEVLTEKEKSGREVDYTTLGEFLYGEVLGIENYKSLIKGVYPVVLGVDSEDNPIVVDLDKETAGVVIGGSGTGKSWLLYSLITGLVIANTPEELNMSIVDIKHSTVLSEFEKFSHVKGYVSKIEDIVKEVRKAKDEIVRRKKLLNEENEENVTSLRNRFKSDGETDRLHEVSLHLLVIDEFTTTVETLKGVYGENSLEYKEFIDVIVETTLLGRAYGVKVLVVGQQAWESTLPEEVVQNSTLKVSLGKEYNGVKDVLLFGTLDIPKDESKRSMGVVSTIRKKELVNFRGLPLATNGQEMLRVIKQVTEKWNERVSEQ